MTELWPQVLGPVTGDLTSWVWIALTGLHLRVGFTVYV